MKENTNDTNQSKYKTHKRIIEEAYEIFEEENEKVILLEYGNKERA